MPVEFLTDEQAGRYGRFSARPNREQLDRHFYLDERDKRLIGPRVATEPNLTLSFLGYPFSETNRIKLHCGAKLCGVQAYSIAFSSLSCDIYKMMLRS